MRVSVKAIPLLVSFAIAAWAQEVRYDYDRTADFSKYRTYNWIPSRTTVDQLTDQEIRRAVDKQLAEKGLVRVEQNPDLLVDYQFTVREQQQIETWGDPAWGPGWRSPTWATTTVTSVPVGTIVVDIFEPARRQLVWRGVGTRTIDPSGDPEKRAKRLDKGMAKLFKNYPPKEKD